MLWRVYRPLTQIINKNSPLLIFSDLEILFTFICEEVGNHFVVNLEVGDVDALDFCLKVRKKLTKNFDFLKIEYRA